MIPLEGTLMGLSTVDLHSQTDARSGERRTSSLSSERNDEVDAMALPVGAENRYLAPRLVAEPSKDMNSGGLGVALGGRFVASKCQHVADELGTWHGRPERLKFGQRDES